MLRRFPGFHAHPAEKPEYRLSQRYQFVDRIKDGLLHIALFLHHQPLAGGKDFNRIQPAGHLNHRRIVKMPGKTLRVDGGSDNQLEVRPSAITADVTEQEIDIQTALVSLIDNQCIVSLQQRIALRLGSRIPPSSV